MSAEDDEDARLEEVIAAENWCQECQAPIGCGDCLGCIAVASMGDEDESA